MQAGERDGTRLWEAGCKRCQHMGLDLYTQETVILIVLELVRPAWGNDADDGLETEFRAAIFNKKCVPKLGAAAEQYM